MKLLDYGKENHHGEAMKDNIFDDFIRSNGEPPTWIAIKQDIELKIIQGEYSAGERIPPVRKIAEIYGIGTSTAAKTLETLSSEGTLFKKRGVGYFVKPYVKESLCREHQKNLEKILLNTFAYADIIGVDLLKMVGQIYKSRYE